MKTVTQRHRKPNGYWTEKVIVNELKSIISQKSRFPTQTELSTMKRADLMGAISGHGGFEKFRELLGHDLHKKPNGYWTFENTMEELKKIIIERGHFPTNTELIKLGRTDITNGASNNGGLYKFRKLLGYELSQKPRGYWTDDIIIGELKKIIDKTGRFPTERELLASNQQGLSHAISYHGGSKKYRKLLGHDPLRKTSGYWTFENTMEELKKIIIEIGHFPTNTELIKIGRSGISNGMMSNGGSNKFRKLLEYELPQKPAGYWTDETIMKELEKTEKELKHFPTQTELKEIGRVDLQGAISEHGGLNKFREKSGHKLLKKPNGYWTEERVINELKKIESELKHFPTHKELTCADRHDLKMAIKKHGGSNKFRKILGRELLKKPNGYWTNETIIDELKKIESKLSRSPILKELGGDLQTAIQLHGGMNKFREILGWDSPQRPDKYWTDETIIDELKKIESELKHFPTQKELMKLDRNDVMGAISKNGGLLKFREALGYSISLYKQYCMESAIYNSRRGTNTERILKTILIDWCKQNSYPPPTYNKKLATNNVIEFICNTGKTIGIDTTNTKTPDGNCIRRKYRKKDYHKYLDELWIVVFSNVFGEQDYLKFNKESPDNVRVMSIDTFLEVLDISTDEHLRTKIENYKNCTFRTKDEFVKRHLNKSLEEYIHEPHLSACV